MRWRILLLAAIGCAMLVTPASAQSLFSKKKPAPKPSPAEKLSQLITTLKIDQDEKKRESAAVELRHFDTKTYPEVVPVLIECLQNDPRPAVRMEAAQSLGRLRPVSQQGGWALEQAMAKDSSLRVRTQARMSLTWLRVNGYRSEGKPPDDATPPPGAQQPGAAAPIPPVPKTTQPSAASRETAPPPLAVPPGSAQPLPTGPKILPVPAKPPTQGPDLTPPG